MFSLARMFSIYSHALCSFDQYSPNIFILMQVDLGHQHPSPSLPEAPLA